MKCFLFEENYYCSNLILSSNRNNNNIAIMKFSPYPSLKPRIAPGPLFSRFFALQLVYDESQEPPYTTGEFFHVHDEDQKKPKDNSSEEIFQDSRNKAFGFMIPFEKIEKEHICDFVFTSVSGEISFATCLYLPGVYIGETLKPTPGKHGLFSFFIVILFDTKFLFYLRKFY